MLAKPAPSAPNAAPADPDIQDDPEQTPPIDRPDTENGGPMIIHAPVSTEQLPERDGDSGQENPLLAELTAAAVEDRACDTHEAVRFQLKSDLHWAHLRPDDKSTIVDMLVPSLPGEDDGPVLYEVLRAGQTSYQAVRAGALRLREINHISQLGSKRLYVVLPGPPEQSWAAEAVSQVLGVSVMWWLPRGWGGDDHRRATGADLRS
jgi:hypothetical protein